MAAGHHAGRRTAHATLIAEILSLLGGKEREPAPIAPTQLREQLTESEIRVLRYLPTNLRAPEIASDLCLSVNTIRTHVRHVYEKLAAHSRIEAVERARALGLLAPSSLRA
jgi:LuxR family maltose regulon positive regulatory protein